MFERIDDNFYLSESLFNIDILDTLPIFYHAYNSEIEIPDELCWMSYSGLEAGEISFTRNTNKYLPEVTKYVTDYMQQFVTISHRLSPERIHFIRTRGSVFPHIDESSRKCCLNIGLKNSNSAIVRISKSESIDTFLENSESHVYQDGSMYLLNTSLFHAVDGNTDISRILITYGFSRDFGTIRSILK